MELLGLRRGLENSPRLSPALIVEPHDRNLSFNKEMQEALRKAGNSRVTETETDHSYSDHRIALQAATLE
ncbi:MAG: hypothetical protein DMG49_21755 [Acidobacteria bacterium]|nr:MAG: hypothetical protein DMG49_21755 [Acidobacteriota bacterium]